MKKGIILGILVLLILALILAGCETTGEAGKISGKTKTPAQCRDKIDNDGDGLIDYPADPDCTSLRDRTENTICGDAYCNSNSETCATCPEDCGECRECTDSDKGAKYDKPGTLIIVGIKSSHADYCLGNYTLKEYSCTPPPPDSNIIDSKIINVPNGFYYEIDYNCPNGCENGACLQKTNSITQFGITWTFDKPLSTDGSPGTYQYGQFANGDYWVKGPVTIANIEPTPTGSRNGFMINPMPGSSQGYDSRAYGFDSSLSLPRVVPAGSSVVSTISLADSGEPMQTYLQTAAVLTVLDSAAPEGSFRPAYSSLDKSIRFNKADLDYSSLSSLPPVAETPAMSGIETYFERPWIDHVSDWTGRAIHPADNMPDYGRDISTQIGEGALMLHLDYPAAQKETLLIRYVQLGIDLSSIATNGGDWPANGGHGSGRKWPILFAGIVLNNAGMAGIGSHSMDDPYFGEDSQTFYVSQADVDLDHSNCDPRGGACIEYEQSDIGLVEWGISHATRPETDNKLWEAPYRQCCTASSWAGNVLAAYIMDQKQAWNHDALFDYMDRYMATEDGPFRQTSDFVESMWDTYRADYGDVWSPSKTFYVSPNGAGTHDGTQGNEFSLTEAQAHADENLNKEITFILGQGEYGKVSFNTARTAVATWKASPTSNPIFESISVSSPGSQLEFDGITIIGLGAQTQSYGIYIMNGDHITVKNSEISESLYGIRAMGYKIDIKGNDIHSIGSDHIMVLEPSSSIFIEGNRLSSTNSDEMMHPDGIQIYGAPDSGNISDVFIRDNVFYNLAGQGIYVVRSQGPFIIERNNMSTIELVDIRLQEAHNGIVRDNYIETYGSISGIVNMSSTNLQIYGNTII